MEDRWISALIVGIITLALLFVATFLKFVQKLPINWVIYILFTLCFTYVCGYLSSLSKLFFFGLLTLCIVSFGITTYVWLNDSYIKYW